MVWTRAMGIRSNAAKMKQSRKPPIRQTQTKMNLKVKKNDFEQKHLKNTSDDKTT